MTLESSLYLYVLVLYDVAYASSVTITLVLSHRDTTTPFCSIVSAGSVHLIASFPLPAENARMRDTLPGGVATGVPVNSSASSLVNTPSVVYGKNL